MCSIYHSQPFSLRRRLFYLKSIKFCVNCQFRWTVVFNEFMSLSMSGQLIYLDFLKLLFFSLSKVMNRNNTFKA